LAVILNLTPVPRQRYRIGLPHPGKWREVLNSDAAAYGGSNVGNFGSVTAEAKSWHNLPCSAEFTLPPLSILVFRPERPVVEQVVGAAPASSRDRQIAAEASRKPAEVSPAGGPNQPETAPGSKPPAPEPGATPAGTIPPGDNRTP